MTEIPDDLKLVWGYLIHEGLYTDGEFSYFGGGFDSPHKYDPDAREAFLKNLLEEVKKHGVAWDASGIPEYREMSEFVGTDAPSERVDCIFGVLMLTNGQRYGLGVAKPANNILDALERLNDIGVVDNSKYINLFD